MLSLVKSYRLIDKLMQKSLSLPSEAAFFFANLDFLEKEVLYPHYQAYLENHAPHLPELTEQEAGIVASLNQTGFHITSLSALGLPNTEQFWASAQNLSRELEVCSHHPLNQGRHTLTATADQLMRYPEVVLWGTANRLLRVIEGYLRLPVAYDTPSYYYGVADGRLAGPRKWHRDKEDWRMVKVCVYLHDVDENGGPFEITTPLANTQLHQRVNHNYQVLLDSQANQLLDPLSGQWFTSCTGKAGTVIFADTALFYHRGKPPVNRDRSAIFFSYFSQRPRHPFFCGRSPLSQANLRELARDLPSHLQEALLWRDNLPQLGQWIPKNRERV